MCWLDHISKLFCILYILKVPDIVELKTAVIMYKAYNSSLPMNLQKLFILYDSIYLTRQCSIQNVHVPIAKVCVYRIKV